MIHYQCQCGYERDISDESAGKSVRCPKCKNVGQVPFPQYAEISTDPADYADDSPYEAAAFKTADRGDLSARKEPTDNDVLLGVLFFLKIFALVGVVGTAFATAIAASHDGGAPIAAAVLFAGLTSSAWTYAGAEAIRLLVEIERNTRLGG